MPIIRKLKNFWLKNFTKDYWKSSRGANWHKVRQLEFDSDFEAFSSAICSQVENMGNFETTIEIGTGTGALITKVRSRLSNCNNFIGIDINKKQIHSNNLTYKDMTNVKFIYSDFDKYIKHSRLDNTLIISQNTFDYFKYNDLEKAFSYIYKSFNNVAIAVSTNIAHNNIEASEERQHTGLKVYSHNYSRLLKVTGFHVIPFAKFGDTQGAIVVSGFKVT